VRRSTVGSVSQSMTPASYRLGETMRMGREGHMRRRNFIKAIPGSDCRVAARGARAAGSNSGDARAPGDAPRLLAVVR
jgi:hypothetical protein